MSRSSRKELDEMGVRIAVISAESDAALHELLTELRAFDRGGEVDNPEETEAKRWGTSRGTDDNMVCITIQLPADEAAIVLEAMRNATETCDRANGVVAMAETTLSGDNARPGRSPVEVMVHVDATTLAGHTVVGDGIPAESAKRLLCDCGVVPALDDEAERIIDVGRKRQTVSTAVRRALAARA